MAQIPAQQVIVTLAELHGLTRPDGTVIQAEFARKTGIAQSTLSRILSGGFDRALTRDSISKLMSAFSVSKAQATGIEPIRRNRRQRKVIPTEDELELIRELRKLSGRDRKLIESLIMLQRQLAEIQ